MINQQKIKRNKTSINSPEFRRNLKHSRELPPKISHVTIPGNSRELRKRIPRWPCTPRPHYQLSNERTQSGLKQHYYYQCRSRPMPTCLMLTLLNILCCSHWSRLQTTWHHL